MNQLVQAWDRHQRQAKHDGSDAIDVDEETKIQFPPEKVEEENDASDEGSNTPIL